MYKYFTKCVSKFGIETISVSSSDHYDKKLTTQKIKSNIYAAFFKISTAKRTHGFLSCKSRMATTDNSLTSALALVPHPGLTHTSLGTRNATAHKI